MKPARKFLRAGIVIGGLLLLSPAVGMLGTALGMMHAFHSLGDAGIADPRVLSDNVRLSLVSTAAGLVGFCIGAVLLTVCLVLSCRPPGAPPLPPAGSADV